MTDKGKVTLLAERLWLIRSQVSTPAGELVETRYYETVPAWNKSPMEATLFQNYEAAEAHLGMVRHNFNIYQPKGRADGNKEVFDIVSLYTEMLNSPNAKKITVKDGKIIPED